MSSVICVVWRVRRSRRGASGGPPVRASALLLASTEGEPFASLYACGYTDDMNQAKAIAAVEAGSLVPGVHGGGRRTAQHGA